MGLDNNKKKSQLVFPILFFFSFIRSVAFANETLTGFDFHEKEITFDFSNTVFLILILLYSILNSSLIFIIHKKHGNKCWLPCLLLIIDPVFLVYQRHSDILLLHVLWLLHLNNQLAKKTFVKDFSLILFLLTTTIISPKNAFGFIILAILIDLLPRISNAQKNKKNIIFLFSSVLATVLGIIGHNILYTKVLEFKSFIDLLSPSRFVEKSKVIDVLLLSTPSLLLGIYFLYVVFNTYKKTQKNNKKRIKQYDKTKILMSIVCSAYILLFVGCIFGGYETMCLISLFAPTVILSLIFTENETVSLSLSDIYNLIHEHSAISIVIFISVYYICIKFYLHQFASSIIATFFVWSA